MRVGVVGGNSPPHFLLGCPLSFHIWLVGVGLGLRKRPCRFAKPLDSRVLSLYIRDPGGRTRHTITTRISRPGSPSSPPPPSHRRRLAAPLLLLSLVLLLHVVSSCHRGEDLHWSNLTGTLVSGNLRRTVRAKPCRNCTKFIITPP